MRKKLFILLALAKFGIGEVRIEFERSYGGSFTDEAHSVVVTSAGEYIVAGFTYSTDGDVVGGRGFLPDYWIIKLNSSGVIMWQRVAGGSDADYAQSVAKTSDGGCIVVGYSYSTDGDISGHHGSRARPDIWVVKLNFSGELEWERSLGGVGRDEGFQAKEAHDGGYILVGTTYEDGNDVPGNHGASDFFVAKLDRNGEIEWARCYGGSSDDGAYAVALTNDGGYVIAGYTYSNDGQVYGNNGWMDCWIVKIDSIGEVEWQRCVGGGRFDEARDIKQTPDGGYIVTGQTTSISHGEGDLFVFKLAPDGSIEWQRSFGGSLNECGFAVDIDYDGGYIIAGSASSSDFDVANNHGGADFWVIKLDIDGELIWAFSLGGSRDDCALGIARDLNRRVIVVGYSKSNDFDISHHHGSTLYADFWFVKLAPTIGIEQPPFINKAEYSFEIYPNPFNSNCVIVAPSNRKIRVLNLQGQEIQTSIAKTAENRYTWQPEPDIPQGMYIVEIELEKAKVFKKMLYIK